jgi:hypothetical protein
MERVIILVVALGSPPALLRETRVQANNNVDPEKVRVINGDTAENVGKPTWNQHHVSTAHRNREGTGHEDTR